MSVVLTLNTGINLKLAGVPPPFVAEAHRSISSMNVFSSESLCSRWRFPRSAEEPQAPLGTKRGKALPVVPTQQPCEKPRNNGMNT